MLREVNLTDKNILLLTIAVSPRAAGPLALANPESREQQYSRALSLWAHNASLHFDEIHVIETSGFDFENSRYPFPLAEISVFPIEVPAEINARGKGAAEFYALDRYFEARGPETMSWTYHKVTGRLFVANFAECLFPVDGSVFMSRIKLNRSYVDTRVMSASGGVWRTVLPGLHKRMHDAEGRVAEVVLAATLSGQFALGDLVQSRYRRRPAIVGSSGTTGVQYGRWSPASVLIRPVETILWRISSWKQV